MSTLGERLKAARLKRKYTQQTLATAIGVSRGVIFNLEKNLTEPQEIVTNAICQELQIRREWLLDDVGEMELQDSSTALLELHHIAKRLSEQEQLFLLDVAQALLRRFGDSDQHMQS